MKKYNTIVCFIFVMLISCYVVKGQTNEQKVSAFKITPEDVIASTHIKGWHFESFMDVAIAYNSEQTQLKTNLLAILDDPKSTAMNQYCAAYYLGELKASEAVTSLAAKIRLSLNDTDALFSRLPGTNMGTYSAMIALIKIGTPSIPAVMGNLAESDDTLVRQLSLEVVERIDNDKDITHLRLEKALKAEKDAQKQARLQAALKALTETK